MKRRKYKYALITGASSGLGMEFARQLTQMGYVPILVARRKERLIELAEQIENQYHVECTVFPADLTNPTECKRIFRFLEDKPVGIIINNAGYGDCGSFMDTDLGKELSMIDLNVKALHIISKLALHKFRKQKGGYLLNVASSAGLFPAGPYMATYYATKSYVSSLTEAIAVETIEQGYDRIHISALCPGPVDTEFNAVANVEFSLPGISAEYCVEVALKGLMRGDLVIIPTLRMKLAIFAVRLLPRFWIEKLTGHQQKKKFKK